MNFKSSNKQKVLSLKSVSKVFDETTAVNSVTIDFFRGEILGLIGPNGSGKTTLMNLACGNLFPDSGEIFVNGHETIFRHTRDAIGQGICMLSQSTEIYPDLSVLENVFIGHEIVRSVPLLRLMAWKRMREATKRLLIQVGAESLTPDDHAGVLSGGQKKSVALARLLALDARFVVFDEPVASLGTRQKDHLFQIINSMAGEGRSIVLISHDLYDVLSLCNRIVLLRSGQVILDRPKSGVTYEFLSTQMSALHHGSKVHSITTNAGPDVGGLCTNN